MEHNSASECYMIGSCTLEKQTQPGVLFIKSHRALSMLLFDKSKALKKYSRPFCCISLYHFQVGSQLL